MFERRTTLDADGRAVPIYRSGWDGRLRDYENRISRRKSHHVFGRESGMRFRRAGSAILLVMLAVYLGTVAAVFWLVGPAIALFSGVLVAISLAIAVASKGVPHTLMSAESVRDELLQNRLCASCAYGLTEDDLGMFRCSECGALWRRTDVMKNPPHGATGFPD